MGKTWRKHGKDRATRGNGMAKTWQRKGEAMAKTWQRNGQDTAKHGHGRDTAKTWRVHGGRIANACQRQGKNMDLANTWQPHGKDTATTWQRHGKQTATTWPGGGRATTSINNKTNESHTAAIPGSKTSTSARGAPMSGAWPDRHNGPRALGCPWTSGPSLPRASRRLARRGV